MKLFKEFTKAYDQFADAIFRHCCLRLSDRERAKDIMQETFLKTWDYALKNEGTIENLRALLYKTANNLIIDEYKKRKNEVSLEGMQDAGVQIGERESIHENITIKMEFTRIISVINKVDDKYKEAVMMRYVDGLKPKEIAKLLKLSQNNTSVRINRGVGQLRKLLENEG